MKIFIDTNVILDVLENREPYVYTAKQLMILCEQKKIHGFVSTLTFTNIIYIMRKHLDPDKIEYLYKSLSEIFNFTSLTADDMANAVGFHWADYEDALQAASAQRIGADFIITRNTKDFNNEVVMCMMPVDFLENIANNQEL